MTNWWLRKWPGAQAGGSRHADYDHRLTFWARRAGVGLGDSSGYFFVEGQIKRHGCDLSVPVKSFALRSVASRSGAMSSSADFNFLEAARKFESVTLRLSLSLSCALILRMLSSDCCSGLSAAVISFRC